MISRENIIKFADKHLAPYRIRGNELQAEICPICNGGDHADKWTFSLNMEEAAANCRRGSCGWKGNFSQLAKYFGEQVQVERDRVQAAKVAKKYTLPSEEALLPVTNTIIDYFKQRGISKETVAAFRICADEKGNIVFPFYQNDLLTYVKYREPRIPAPKRKEWQMSGTCPILFNMDGIDVKKPLIITEGQIDAMSCYEAGYTNVTSVPGGCDNEEWVETCWEWLDKVEEIILFGDNDAPGRKMVQTIARRLGEYRCRIVSDYPVSSKLGRECKDANEILLNCGDFVLGDVIESAKTVPIKGLIDLADVHPVDPTTVERIKTMVPKLDESIGGLRLGAITVFTGRAGNGKSTLAGLLLLNAIEQGYNVCAYSGELPKEDFQEWINLQAAGSDYITLKYDAVKGKSVPVLPYAVQKSIIEWYRGHFFLFDSTEVFEKSEAESIIEVFQVAARRHNCKLFLIDNLMTAMSDTEEETKAQGRFMNALKRFAIRYDCHVIIVAHPRKTKTGEQIGQDDIGGNSATVKLAHSAIVVERPNLRIIKARDAGLTGFIECCYCGDSRRIYQMDVGDKNMFSWDKTGVQMPSLRADSLPEYGIHMSPAEPF